MLRSCIQPATRIHINHLKSCLPSSKVLKRCLSSPNRPKVDEGLARALAREQGKHKSSDGEKERSGNRQWGLYMTSLGIVFLGLSYAAVPLYQAFCRATGYGGQTQVSSEEKFRRVRPVPGAKPITVHFAAQTADDMPWSFTPIQDHVQVVPGETALVFYRARNTSDKPVIGVSTYNVVPFSVGVHFEKIQCFCFEYQRLKPHEEVDMPIFFYVDPEFVNDPAMAGTRDITLSYTFFKCDEDKDQEMKQSGDDVRAWTQRVSKEVGVERAS